MKRFRLVALAKKISKQVDINSFVWLLKFTLMKSVLMKRSKLRKENYKMYDSSNKKTPGRAMELNPVIKEINRLREW